MVCIGNPGSSIMESDFWDLKHQLCPLTEKTLFGLWAGPWGTLWGSGRTKDGRKQTSNNFGTRLGCPFGCVSNHFL
jgi:hypothetical protein